MDYDLNHLHVIEKLRDENVTFVGLEKEHKILKNRIKELELHKYLSTEEEISLKTMKRTKLLLKEKIMKMISDRKEVNK